MRHSMRWSRWALLVPFCIGCGRSSGEADTGDGTAGRMVSSGGSVAASGGNASGAAGAASAPAGGSNAAGAGGNPTSGAGGNPTSGAGGSPTSGAGGATLGGEAGEFSGGGTPTAGTSSGGTENEGGAPGDPLAPVSVIRGGSDEYWDLTIRGEDLDAYDGKRVLVRIGDPERPPERLGSGDALIASGTFELVFPAVWETGLYKVKLGLIDVDGDRACDLSVDRLFGDSRGSPVELLVVSTEHDAGGNYFREYEPAAGERYCDAWFNREWPLE
jgi:hypothetical protein